MSIHQEISFETEIRQHLSENGWLHAEGDAAGYDRKRALYSPDLMAWVQETQPKPSPPSAPPRTPHRADFCRRHRPYRRARYQKTTRMIPIPKTIQIYLPGGDPQGIRVAEITTRIVQVIEVPRSLLPEFLKMPESGQVALYFLIGESEDVEERRVYVGQTGIGRTQNGWTTWKAKDGKTLDELKRQNV